MVGFERKVSDGNVLSAELRSIWEVLGVAKKEFIQKIVIFFDCITAINMLDHPVGFINLHFNILSQCRELSQEFEELRYTFISRNQNQSTDKMAKECRASSLEVMYLGLLIILLVII